MLKTPFYRMLKKAQIQGLPKPQEMRRIWKYAAMTRGEGNEVDGSF
jgi:hypothetical protein